PATVLLRKRRGLPCRSTTDEPLDRAAARRASAQAFFPTAGCRSLDSAPRNISYDTCRGVERWGKLFAAPSYLQALLPFLGAREAGVPQMGRCPAALLHQTPPARRPV